MTQPWKFTPCWCYSPPSPPTPPPHTHIINVMISKHFQVFIFFYFSSNQFTDLSSGVLAGFYSPYVHNNGDFFRHHHLSQFGSPTLKILWLSSERWDGNQTKRKLYLLPPFKGPSESSSRRHQAADSESHSSRVASVQKCGEISCQIHHLNYPAPCFLIMYNHM